MLCSGTGINSLATGNLLADDDSGRDRLLLLIGQHHCAH